MHTLSPSAPLPRFARAHVLAALLGVALAGCGDKATPGAGSSEASSAGAKSASSTKAAATPPKDVDATVTAALEKLSSCKRENDSMQDCAEEEGWKTFQDKYVENDDEDGTRAKKLARSCLANVSHASPNVRQAAAYCVSAGGSDLDGEASALALVLKQLEGETAADASSALAQAVESLDPVKRGAGDQTLALLKKMREKDAPGWSTLLDALASDKGTPDGAVDLAIEIIDKGKGGGVESAIGLLEKSKARKADACKSLLAKVKTGKYLWSRAMNGMGNLECADDVDAIVDFVVTKMAEEDGYEKGFGGADFIYLERMMDKLKLTPDQIGKLKKATTELKGNTKNDTVKTDCDKLLETLSKK